jgi:Rod binding domain-containing protein
MSTISGISPASFVAAADWMPQAIPALSKGAKAARDFEAQLIGNVLESMEKTFAELPGQSSIAGDDNYNYMGTQALASALAAGGGFGIAPMILSSFERTKGVSGVGEGGSGKLAGPG